ncbi:MAG: MFS transporter [Alistipes sp.]|jgi:MFS family permease|nr:MFS transporter [Alistipes sp.]
MIRNSAAPTGIEIPRERLWTRSYVLICIANFLMSFAFYTLVPTLPFYLGDVFGAGRTTIGIILSCYTVAVLFVRPFAGWIADTFARKPLYILAYFLFISFFVGYLAAGTLLVFGLLRVMHGLLFGMVTTTGNTLVIDIMPSSRRGEGLGYYGVMNNLAMSIGPMMGLFIMTSGNYDLIFYSALISGGIGLIFASSVKAPRVVPKTSNQAVSFDRFILRKGIPAAGAMLPMAVPWGMTMTFIAMHAGELGLVANTGYFFTVMAAGLIISRIGSGKRVDRGEITQVILQGMLIVFAGIVCEAFLGMTAAYDLTLGYVLYFAAAFLIGFGYGTIFPASNTLFVNLAPNDRRATANATYLTGWDVGIGLGMFFGGRIAERWGLGMIYWVNVFLAAGAIVWFASYVAPHFHRNRLR